MSAPPSIRLDGTVGRKRELRPEDDENISACAGLDPSTIYPVRTPVGHKKVI
jgi:hypothetical protein